MAGMAGFDCQQCQALFLFAVLSRPALELTQFPVKWVQVGRSD